LIANVYGILLLSWTAESPTLPLVKMHGHFMYDRERNFQPGLLMMSAMVQGLSVSAGPKYLKIILNVINNRVVFSGRGS
jgi:hypothetical protein